MCGRARLLPSRPVQRVLGSAGTSPARNHETRFGNATLPSYGRAGGEWIGPDYS